VSITLVAHPACLTVVGLELENGRHFQSVSYEKSKQQQGGKTGIRKFLLRCMRCVKLAHQSTLPPTFQAVLQCTLTASHIAPAAAATLKVSVPFQTPSSYQKPIHACTAPHLSDSRSQPDADPLSIRTIRTPTPAASIPTLAAGKSHTYRT
jgi:hypothetical protein